MTVNIRRLAPGEQPAKTQVDVPHDQTVGTTYPAAAQAAVRRHRRYVEGAHRHRFQPARPPDRRCAHRRSLAQWGEIQTALAGVGNVTGVTVTAMDIGYARINLTYQGSLDQLREALGGAGLSLSNRGGQWMLASNGSKAGNSGWCGICRTCCRRCACWRRPSPPG